ncbi:cobalamin biosynthesis protein CobD [Sedimentibacter sp. zth1]|uniref:adenosylcobinamide-phosphate synthase CbiB n=1 Tax=Sedimentibacter sp. zth1 TaxID=2816908 RepID=UPI001A930374|nr:adenosylcobinamide-phosphate synthase CbiB [Sedimentibacter sp. zth1]QSX06338.1 cobalamin biosynthesis protein CobD [Sedimentibacter sp. zth1]
MHNLISLVLGYILDLIIGDPQNAPHPIRLIGSFISKLENKLRCKCKNEKDEYKSGVILWFVVVFISFLIPFFIITLAYRYLPVVVAIIIDAIMCYYILATKCLKVESMKVYAKLKQGNIMEARKFLSYIVGRDTKSLDETEIVKACVETVAENTSDGVIAPLLFILIGGAPLGFMYKAINTLDSMVGYKSEKYINMGRFSAKADDIANYIPARISAYLMIVASFIIKLDYKNAYKIYKRDRYNHLSPNSAHTESVCAGALDIKLAGGSYYGGTFVEKPTIGDDIRKIQLDDVKISNKLMYATSWLCFFVGILIKLIIVKVI